MSSENKKLSDVDDYDERYLYPVYIATLILSIMLIGGSIYRFTLYLI